MSGLGHSGQAGMSNLGQSGQLAHILSGPHKSGLYKIIINVMIVRETNTPNRKLVTHSL